MTEGVFKRHTLSIDNNTKANLTGISGVVSIFDREIVVTTQNKRIVIKGSGLSASKLNIEEGNLLIEGENISAVLYTEKAKKLSFKGMFK